MGHEIQYILETKRLVWLVAVVFAVVIMFQYFEFPYGDVASSLFSATRGQTPTNGSYPAEASQIADILGNITHIADILDKDNRTIYKGDDIGIDNDIKKEDSHNVSGSTLQENDSRVVNPIPMSPPPLPSSPAPLTSQTKANTSISTDLSKSVDKPSSVKESHKRPMGNVVTISEMHEILAHNRATSRSMKPRWSSVVDQELLDAKLQIENAPMDENDRSLYPPLYLNVSRFRRSYELMEKTLKVYVYKEGEKPIFHKPQAMLSGKYASEGWFMKHMTESKQFVTKDPKQAHLFYLPFSSRMLQEVLYVPGSHNRRNMVHYLKDYIDLVAGRYDFWNRTGGSDHFLAACHDWAADETKIYMETCIRALCNSDVKREGFKLGKDVSLPETYVRSTENPTRQSGGNPAFRRPVLAFFAGTMLGYVRPILLRHWKDKDPDMKIFGKLPKSKGDENYVQYMKTSKFCICPKGYEVNSPRVVEAIFYECVPVIVSDNFVPPFFEILNWESFAVFVLEKEIPYLKKILGSISERRYRVMQQRVKQVQKHFLWHVKPVKYDMFHMILHSIWYNRVFRVNP